MGRTSLRQLLDEPAPERGSARRRATVPVGRHQDADAAGRYAAWPQPERPALNGTGHPVHRAIAHLQREAGNRAVQRLLRGGAHGPYPIDGTGSGGGLRAMLGQGPAGAAQPATQRAAGTGTLVLRHPFGTSTPNDDAGTTGAFDEQGAAGPVACAAPTAAGAPEQPDAAAATATGPAQPAAPAQAPSSLDELVAQGAGLVARQDTAAPVASGPLADAAVANAIAYYRVQPWKYTPAIVSELRTRLGLDPTGGIDADLVQAVALAQQSAGGTPALVVDGKAGPRTLPRLFPSGLNAPGEAQAYSAAVQTGVQAQWATLATPEARATALMTITNQRLAAAGVPAVTLPSLTGPQGNVGDCGEASGEFNFPAWEMVLPRAPFEPATLDDAAATDLANTVYHEARHAQQWFMMAQFLAGRGRSAGGIAAEMGIPRAIAQAAVANPLPRGSMQALIAEGWFDSVYGDFADRRERVLNEVEAAAKAVCRAQERVDANPTEANQAALARAEERFDRAFARYQDLPEENDAFATADPVQIVAASQPGTTPGTTSPTTQPGTGTSTGTSPTLSTGTGGPTPATTGQ